MIESEEDSLTHGVHLNSAWTLPQLTRGGRDWCWEKGRPVRSDGPVATMMVNEDEERMDS